MTSAHVDRVVRELVKKDGPTSLPPEPASPSANSKRLTEAVASVEMLQRMLTHGHLLQTKFPGDSPEHGQQQQLRRKLRELAHQVKTRRVGDDDMERMEQFIPTTGAAHPARWHRALTVIDEMLKTIRDTGGVKLLAE